MARQQPQHIDVPAYLLVEPEWSRWGSDAEGRSVLEGGKVVRVTKGRPQSITKGAVVVKVTLRMPAGVFLPLQPEAVVIVSAENADTVVVEATDPREDAES